MARKLRVWYRGAMYHITSRGNRRTSLFYDTIDHQAYMDILEETRNYYPFHLHSYCLMTNHLHLQVETIQHHPQHMMKMINSRYAMHFNKRHRLVGHVFQGRYGAELLETKDYQLEVSRYIHRNPSEANMVPAPESYCWSSYRAYVLNEQNEHVKTDKLLGYFSEPVREKYREYVEG
ncbi:transposase [Virgibacillus halodenitrificans]|uniref:transposase n=1 Tax=Virgibacillus halodenitrificans TaxID=1482 RepID=UPI0002F74097|nr:transposase [Virgibacillus halodenitrificans]